MDTYNLSVFRFDEFMSHTLWLDRLYSITLVQLWPPSAEYMSKHFVFAVEKGRLAQISVPLREALCTMLSIGLLR